MTHCICSPNWDFSPAGFYCAWREGREAEAQFAKPVTVNCNEVRIPPLRQSPSLVCELCGPRRAGARRIRPGEETSHAVPARHRRPTRLRELADLRCRWTFSNNAKSVQGRAARIRNADRQTIFVMLTGGEAIPPGRRALRQRRRRITGRLPAAPLDRSIHVFARRANRGRRAAAHARTRVAPTSPTPTNKMFERPRLELRHRVSTRAPRRRSQPGSPHRRGRRARLSRTSCRYV